MLKIKKNVSVTISLVLAWIALAGIIIVAGAVPFFGELFIKYMSPVAVKRYVPGLILLILALVTVGVADILLILLLRKVRQAQVFTPTAVALLRGISWCCFVECVILMAKGCLLVMPGIIIVAAVAAFLGIVLRVVKNVIEEATAIKSENDFTI